MNASISNSIQNLRLLQRETERPDPAKQREKPEEVDEQDSEIAKDPKDTVEIRDLTRFSTDSSPATHEIKDSHDAQRLVTEISELVNSEDGRPSAEQVHDINPGSLIDLLV